MAEVNTKGKEQIQPVYNYYILLDGRTAEKRDKGYAGCSSDKKFVSLHKGEILFEVIEKERPKTKKSALVRLKPLDRPSLTLECPVTDVRRIDKEEAYLLLPFSSLSERLRVVEEGTKLRLGKKLQIGSNVWVTVQIRSSMKRDYDGVIKYKGPLPGALGTMFGVVLLNCEGKGTTDGSFKDKRYFTCAKDAGMFVSIEKLASNNIAKINKDSKPNTEVNGINEGLKKIKNKIAESFSSWASPLSIQSNDNVVDENIESKIGDIVWVFIEDKLQRGTLRFIGRTAGGRHKLAGIEMDSKCGEGDGEYSGKQLFTCQRDHAHFTPILNVISNEKLGQIYLQPEGVQVPNFRGQPPSTSPSSCEDIVQMESKFANVSETAIIEEQKEIYRKAQAQKEVEDELVNVPEKNIAKGQEDIYRKAQEETKAQMKMEKDKLTNLPEKDIVKKQEDISRKYREETQARENKGGIGRGSRRMMDNYGEFKSDNSWDIINHFPEKKNMDITSSTETTRPGFSKQESILSESLNTDLEVGSLVEVLSKLSSPRYGVIRWIGFTPNSNLKVAGLELEEELKACSDGTFLGKRYFACPRERGLFVHLRNCRPDSRFDRGENPMKSADKRLTGTDFGSFESPTMEGQFIPPPDSLEVYTTREGPCGIQGHHNSCYLDSTLFAAFSFSSVMDSILLRPKQANDIEQYKEVQNVLRDNIVYPLRAHGFVRADRVLELRQLLDKLGTVTGLVGEEKDPEEFLLTLFQQVLKSEPFLKIKSGKEVRNEYFYQVFADKDVERVLPSVEELLKKSFHQSDLMLAEVPSCLIVQMPRFGKGFKMYKRILPSLMINIGELVDNTPQDCAVCGRLAKHHCKDCFSVTGFMENDSSGNFCRECNERIHSHVRRTKHQSYPLVVSRDICASYGEKPVQHREMELFAVVCIETSHYVTFAKCKDLAGVVKWCFFDSMSDRVGTKNGYNIPSVTECPEVVEWLSSEKQNRERIINTDDRDMPDKVRRILGDAYMCLYQSVEMASYK